MTAPSVVPSPGPPPEDETPAASSPMVTAAPEMSLDTLERLADQAIEARDEREIARLRELLRQHPATYPRVVRLSAKLDRPPLPPADRGDSAGRRLAILGISRLDSGDEFGAYLLARAARAEWQAASPWWTSDAVQTLVDEGPTKFPLQDRVTHDAARTGVATIPDEMLREAFAQNVYNRWPRGAVRIFCENEAAESRLFVEGERGCVVLRGRGYSGGGEVQSGDVVVVANSPQTPGSPRLRISGLRHQAAELEPTFSQSGSYWGAVVLHELPAPELGELQVRLEPEEGISAAELADLSLRLGPNRYRMVSIPDWTVNPESRAGEVLRVAPRTYALQVQGPQMATPVLPEAAVQAGSTREVTASLFRRRQVIFEWKYRPGPDAEIIEGSDTVMTGMSRMMVGWEGYARNVTLRVDDWDGRGCRLSIDNAVARSVPDGTWNSRTWIAPKGNGRLVDSPIKAGSNILLGNVIRGSEPFFALVRVREIVVPVADASQE